MLVDDPTDPPDDTVIWRYIPLTRLRTILDGQLFCTRPYKFAGDFWEGQYPPAYARNLKRAVDADEFKEEFARRLKIHKYAHFVSCWNICQYEVDWMWTNYGKAPDGVAIQSTVGKLKRCVRPHNWGRVQYYDPAEELTCSNAFGNPPDILYKRRGYNPEAEFRIWFNDDQLLEWIEQNMDTDIDEAKLKEMNEETFKGKKYPISPLPDLVTNLVVAPHGNIDKVKTMCHEAGKSLLARLVTRSALDRPPSAFMD